MKYEPNTTIRCPLFKSNNTTHPILFPQPLQSQSLAPGGGAASPASPQSLAKWPGASPEAFAPQSVTVAALPRRSAETESVSTH